MDSRRRGLRRIAVVGGSLAGIRAAERLRGLGYEGELTVVEQEPHDPYERYPLSKAFLAPDAAADFLPLRTSSHDVGLLTGTRALGLDLTRRRIQLLDGSRVPFDGLVIATGARPRVPAAKPDSGQLIPLRTLADARLLRSALEARPARIVIVGGGLIGSEVASAVAEHGLSATMVASSPLPLSEAVSIPVARRLLGRHRQRGIRVLTGRRGVGVRRGRDLRVVLDDGSALSANLVVWATGTAPNVEWLRHTDLAIDGGVLCDPTMYAVGQSRVVAAGDVVRMRYPAAKRSTVRLECWQLTIDQAELAAENLLLGPSAARTLATDPCFSSTIHRDRLRVSGYPDASDECRTIWGSIDSGRGLAALGLGGRYIGAVALNATKELNALLSHLPAVQARWTPIDAVAHRARELLGG